MGTLAHVAFILLLSRVFSVAGLQIARERSMNLSNKLERIRDHRTVPKIIHQTWKDDKLPPDFERWSRSWKECLPDWSYKLHTDHDNREMIKDNFPEMLGLYDNYSRIQRVDAARYAYLALEGGLYVDLDMECFGDRHSFPDVSDFDVVLVNEASSEWPQVSNSVMLSGLGAGQQFFKHVLRSLKKYWWQPDILYSTGPQLLTRALLDDTDDSFEFDPDSFEKQAEVFKTGPGAMKRIDTLSPEGHTSFAVLDDSFMLNIRWDDNTTKAGCLNRTWCMQDFPNAVAVSHWSASWRESFKEFIDRQK
mmetsp:Transcript_54034/g.94908  ORF Transcript_54034/g.94908 Transcript_54034/m.94908 type:complete len:306 (+) Transcript_54034:72-989(+)